MTSVFLCVGLKFYVPVNSYCNVETVSSPNHTFFSWASLTMRLTLTLQDTRSIHDSMNLPKIEFIAYIYILYYQSSINFQFSPNLAGFQIL